MTATVEDFLYTNDSIEKIIKKINKPEQTKTWESKLILFIFTFHFNSSLLHLMFWIVFIVLTMYVVNPLNIVQISDDSGPIFVIILCILIFNKKFLFTNIKTRIIIVFDKVLCVLKTFYDKILTVNKKSNTLKM